MLHWIGFILAGFLVGSIPSGWLIARARGVDIRAHGSGNIGATNVGRVLGRRLGALCFALDAIKGALPPAAAGLVLGTWGRWDLPASEWCWWLGVMAAPVVGHMFPPWLGFRGGKGVATGLGALLGVFPLLTAAGAGALVVWLVALRAWGYVSLASMLAAASLPAWVWAAGLAARAGGASAQGPAWVVVALAGALACLVIARHGANIGRLRRGIEPRAGMRARGGPARTGRLDNAGIGRTPRA